MGSRVKPETLALMKQRGEPIAMLTCYDHPTAVFQDAAGVDVIFVGDSVGVNVLGYKSPQQVTMDDMLHHTRAVRRGVASALLMADLPYRAYETPEQAIENARQLVSAGTEVVKLEGGRNITPQVEALAAEGIPVVGHVGYTPQTRTGKRPVFGDRAEEALDVLKRCRCTGVCRCPRSGFRMRTRAHCRSRDQTGVHANHWNRRRARMRWTGARCTRYAGCLQKPFPICQNIHRPQRGDASGICRLCRRYQVASISRRQTPF